MTRIDVKPFVELGERFPRHLYGTHYDGCERYHVECAILYLAGALDSAQSMIEELLADRDSERKWAEQYHAQWQEAKAEISSLRAQLESAKAWMPAWAWEEMNSPEEDEAWKNL